MAVLIQRMGGAARKCQSEMTLSARVDVDGALADEEGADEDGEEDEVAGEAGEHGHAIADELLAGAVTAGVAGIPVLVASATAGGAAIERAVCRRTQGLCVRFRPDGG